MKVSVIIPTYNRPGYLAQAVFSVLQQSHPVFEIVIVDDGSSDINRDKIDDLKPLDDRIRVLHFPENRGVSAARNYGLKESKGEYILFLDDDDLLKPQMVESNLKILTVYPETDVVSSGYGIFFDASRPDKDWSYEQRDTLFPVKILSSWDYGNSDMLKARPFSALLQKSIQMSSCLVRRNVIGNTRFPEDLVRGEDRFFWLVLANSGCRFRINHELLGFYRLHKSNSICIPGWWKNSLDCQLKLFGDELTTSLQDRMIVHWQIARLLVNFDRLQSIKHFYHASRILISSQMVSHWPMMLKAIPVKIHEKWKNRQVRKAFREIKSCKAYGSKG